MTIAGVKLALAAFVAESREGKTMRWLGLLVAAQMSAPVGAIAAEALEAREFLGGKLSMLVPASFKVRSMEVNSSK